MDKKIIDFDKKFEEYMKNWLDDNSSKLSDLDEIETCMPNLYAEWLDTPADWLNGVAPRNYFMSFNVNDLISLLLSYSSNNIGMPDPLLDAILKKKSESAQLLANVVFDKVNLSENTDKIAIRITALNLLNEIGPKDFIDEYINMISNEILDNGICEIMIDTIKQYSNGYEQRLMDAFITSNISTVKHNLADIIVELPFDQKVYDELCSMFQNSEEKALLASYLGKYGNPEACIVLIKSLDWVNINYLDYIEIRNAIEKLGGEASHSRSFDGDIYYESMKGLEND